MTTPIDTTRLRVLLDAVDATEHAYHMCDPVYDERRPAAWHAMDEAQRAFREAWASTSPRALLDEVERLRAMINEAGEGTFNVVALLDLYHTRATEADERAALAYPRALQAAANTAIDAIAGELDVDAERVADAILDLTEEQIDAFAGEISTEASSMTDAQKLASILAILRAAVASGDARARVLADVEEVARG